MENKNDIKSTIVKTTDRQRKREKEAGKQEMGVEGKKKKKEGGGGGCDRLHNCTVHSTNVSILSINPRYKSNLRFGRRGGEIPWGVDRADRGKDPREPGKESGLR